MYLFLTSFKNELLTIYTLYKLKMESDVYKPDSIYQLLFTIYHSPFTIY